MEIRFNGELIEYAESINKKEASFNSAECMYTAAQQKTLLTSNNAISIGIINELRLESFLQVFLTNEYCYQQFYNNLITEAGLVSTSCDKRKTHLYFSSVFFHSPKHGGIAIEQLVNKYPDILKDIAVCFSIIREDISPRFLSRFGFNKTGLKYAHLFDIYEKEGIDWLNKYKKYDVRSYTTR